MLSKEEIEKIKKTLQEYDHYYSDHATDENENIIDEGAEELANIFNNAWYYIEQLEINKQKLIEKLEDKIRYFEENEEFIASNNDNYSDGTVIYKLITEFKEILEIAKGEKE